MSDRVILASSRDHSYDFFSPLSAMIWRRLVGFDVTVLLIDTPEEWRDSHSQVVLDALRIAEADVRWIGRIEGYESATCAQASRQHAAALPFPGDEWLMTSDVDLWPTSKDFYRQHVGCGKDVGIYYANAYEYKYHCTSHVTMKSDTWREVMKIDPSLGLAGNLQRSFDRNLGRGADSWKAWNFDEMYFMSRLKMWGGYPNQCLFVDRPGHPPKDRIDRSSWPGDLSISGKVDSHLIRPGALHENWVRLRPLLAQLIPDSMGWADDYLTKYRIARYRS